MARKVDEQTTRKRRQDILEAALHCFGKKGFHKTTMQDICKTVGLSPGTVYHYFRSKDDIILLFAEQALQETKEFIADLEHARGLEETLTVIVDSILEDDTYEELQVYLEVLCEAGKNKQVGKLLEKADSLALSAIKNKLQQIRRENTDTSENISLHTFAMFVGNQIELLELYKRYRPSSKEMREMAVLCKKVLRYAITEC